MQADEVTDTSNWEQLVIVVRYVKETKIVERCRLLTVNQLHEKMYANKFLILINILVIGEIIVLACQHIALMHAMQRDCKIKNCQLIIVNQFTIIYYCTILESAHNLKN